MDVDWDGNSGGNGGNSIDNYNTYNGNSEFHPGAATASQSPPPFLGCLVPGGPLRTDFVPVDASGTKFTLTLQAPGDLPMPLTLVTEMVCFLLMTPSNNGGKNGAINGCWPPADHGVLVYGQVQKNTSSSSSSSSSNSHMNSPQHIASQNNSQEEESGFELWGALTHTSPSSVVRTGWGQNERLMEWCDPSRITTLTVTLGISLEPLDHLQNLSVLPKAMMTTMNPTTMTPMNRIDHRLLVAQKIAIDLFHYMQSFDTGNNTPGAMMMVPNNVFERWMKRFEARFQRDPNFFMKNTNE